MLYVPKNKKKSLNELSAAHLSIVIDFCFWNKWETKNKGKGQ